MTLTRENIYSRIHLIDFTSTQSVKNSVFQAFSCGISIDTAELIRADFLSGRYNKKETMKYESSTNF